jgi:hypothetical protein
MKNLRKLSVSVTLVFFVTMVAFAGDTNLQPCNPGETHGPPCSSSMASVSTEGAQIELVFPITEAAQLVFESVLPLI